MKEKILIICLDSFKFAYLSQTKFLKNLAEKNQYGRLETVLGYNAAEVTLLTGKMPAEHRIWGEFCFSPKTSPFKLLTYLAFLDNTLLEKPTRLLANLYFNGLRFLSGNNYFFKIHAIPFKTIAYFDTTLKNNWVGSHFKKFPTFFAILKEKKIPYLCFDWPVRVDNQGWSLDLLTRNRDKEKVKNFLKNLDKAQVFWLRLWDLDTTAHQFGTKSGQVKDKLKELDSLCEKLVTTISKNYQAKFLFWSDHGMVDIKKTIDLQRTIKDLDVLLFLDSSLGRFWPKNQQEKIKLLQRLKEFKKDGQVITEKEEKLYGLKFSDNRYGEVIFLANPGVLIFPNFYQKRKPVKAMHGYNPRFPQQKGFYLSTLTKGRKNLKMKDMFAEIKKMIT